MLRHIDNAMNVERYLLRVCAPMLVVKAVCVFSVFGRHEGVIARGNTAFVNLV